MKKVTEFLVHNPYIVYFIPALILIILDLNLNFIHIEEGLLGISLSLCGFLFTAMSIILSLSNDNSYLGLVKKFGKDKELYKLIIVAFLFLIITCILSCVQSSEIINKISSYTLIISIFQIAGGFYYVFRICRGYTKAQKTK